ncbi:hypothetical protein GCM10023115_17230 [Pontixanthobacter gangjinensis]|uniref:Uncharacterized protein n=1 Tax=Pontixanthobacter gangjinensis TaxID=1028742 RepID=A0A6I4SQ48_9SPHN|nr:hypothetical protein [Pontixanthobacter gangjinensis]MXO56967.1 hypothetical protein [Pontixanthobacter gangjinensis]
MKSRFTATTIALAALISAQVTSAQEAGQTCVKQEDLTDAVLFVMPVAYSAFQEKCSGQLESDGFVAREGEIFISRYAGLQEKAWPGAYSFFKTFAVRDAKDDEMSTLFDSLPPELLRPFFELMIEAELGKSIKSADCEKIERVLEPLAPLPPQNFGTLVSTIFDIIPDIQNPKICPVKEK